MDLPRTESPMASQRGVRSFSIHFDGDHADAHVLPAPVLIESIAQIQRIVYLLAKLHRGEPLGQRATFSRALRDDFALLCHVPEPGRYAFPFEIGRQATPDEADPGVTDVCKLFHRVTRAVGDGEAGALHKVVTDARYLGLLTDAYRKAQPAPRSGMSLSIEDHRRRRILDGRRAPQALEDTDWAAGRKCRVSRDTVSGLLVGMNFHERSVRLMRLDGKFITVGYDDDSERPLLRHRRDWIQVSGEVLYDINRPPVSVKHARDFVACDEDDIELADLTLYDVRYRADPPLRFHVTRDPDDKLYDLDGEFGISLSAETRPKLLRELNDALSMLWVEYAEERPERLSPKARHLRAELRDRLRAA